MNIEELNIEELADKYENKSPQEIIDFALKSFSNIAISFSGAEDVVLIDMAKKTGRDFRVFTIDTGRLHPETYRFIEEVRNTYNLRIEVFLCNCKDVEKLVSEKGLFSFYRDGHKECCNVRKVEPLKRALKTLDAWITGQRRDQSKTRVNVPVIQKDPTFEGVVKFNPLANWSSKQVWDYIIKNNVPYNKLHERGYISIGCEPCTKPVLPGQHEREGRWWWEDAEKKECGLHAGNIVTHLK